MPDVGSGDGEPPNNDLAAFVDGLANRSRAPWVKAACAQIKSRHAAGVAPIGLQRLAEAAAAPEVSSQAPSPRRPSDELSGLSAAITEHPLVVLESAGPVATAGELAALLNDGRRVLVTAASRAELAEVRSALPPELAPLCVTRPIPLSPDELRQLRSLLATATPRRQARADQTLPPAELFPSLADVEQLCYKAGRGRAYTGTDVIPELLDALDPERRNAVIEVASDTQHYLDEVSSGPEADWMWPQLTRLVFHRDEQELEQLAAAADYVATAVQDPRTSGMQIRINGPLPRNSIEVLRAYLGFLESGGRSWGMFRSQEQRNAEGVLRQVRIEGVSPSAADGVHRVLELLELRAQFDSILTSCERLGIPAPQTMGDTPALVRRLDYLGAVAASVSALRHDVLFIHPESPIAVPDLPTARTVAAAILAYGGITEIIAAERQLDALGEQVAALVAGSERAPEHQWAVDTLKMCDPTGYAEALNGLAGARRDRQDHARCDELISRLHAEAPELAQAWQNVDDQPLPFGYTWLTASSELLAQLPGPDSADVLLMLGADTLGVEQLLVTAAAPRVVAVTTGVTPITKASNDPPATVLAVMRRLSAPVVWAGRTKKSSVGRKRKTRHPGPQAAKSAVQSAPRSDSEPTELTSAKVEADPPSQRAGA